MDKLTEVATAQCPLNNAKTTTNRQRFNWFRKTAQKTGGMMDPIDCRVSGSPPVHILRNARDPDPLGFGSLALRIAPPVCRLPGGLAHGKQYLIVRRCETPAGVRSPLKQDIIENSRNVMTGSFL